MLRLNINNNNLSNTTSQEHEMQYLNTINQISYPKQDIKRKEKRIKESLLFLPMIGL